MKMLRVTMPDNSVWDVPCNIIANDRARYYSKKEDSLKQQKVFQEEYEYALNNNDELIDWAANNMNWEDVVGFAVLYKLGNTDYQEGWMNGKKKIVETK